jgi:endonuclease/exonuclease/phosphatase family metal-dependent hydrolase
MIVAVSFVGIAIPASAATLAIKVLTYNTGNGNVPSAQLDTMAAQNPDVVVLQEAGDYQLATYVDGMNKRLATTAWHGAYARHCQTGTQPTCTSYTSETVMILTRLRTVSTDKVLIWASDSYHIARGAVHMTVALSDGTQVNVFGCHLPALLAGRTARVAYVSALQAWAQKFASPRLVGGDFNDSPGTSPIVAMTQQYYDAWAIGGSGSGYTHSHDRVTLVSRIDYWFSDKGGAEALAAVKVVGSLTASDHLAVVAAYTVPSKPASTETALMDDRFGSFVSSNWPYGVFTGTQDSTIPLTVNGGFQIGALKASTTGGHYNGVSSPAYDLSHNGSAYVQLVHPPNTATTAYAMFAAGSDGSNFYRWYESGNALVAEKKVAGTKTALVNLPYDATADQFLRIRRQYNTVSGVTEVLFETAPNNAGVPGTFSVRHREPWDSHVVATAMRFELKAGTSTAVISPGTAAWDNFHAASNTK